MKEQCEESSNRVHMIYKNKIALKLYSGLNLRIKRYIKQIHFMVRNSGKAAQNLKSLFFFSFSRKSDKSKFESKDYEALTPQSESRVCARDGQACTTSSRCI